SPATPSSAPRSASWRTRRPPDPILLLRCVHGKAILPPGEMSFLVPPSGVSSQASLESERKSNKPMQQSFRELGVSSPVVDTLAASSITAPFSIHALALPVALGGLDLLPKPPSGS